MPEDEPHGIVSPVVRETGPHEFKYKLLFKGSKQIYFATDSILVYIRKIEELRYTRIFDHLTQDPEVIK